jgi:hypothetical protein
MILILMRWCGALVRARGSLVQALRLSDKSRHAVSNSFFAQ